jgi:Flp pilus assembly protein TadD
MSKAQRRKSERRAVSAPPPVRRSGAVAATGADPVRALLAPMLIAVVVLALYASSFAIPFLFDDFFEITDNPGVKAIEPALAYLRRSRGIPAFTLALNYRWGGFDVWGYHLVNVAVHFLNGLLVYALVRRTLDLPTLRQRYGRHAGVLATFVALVFVAHPLQTMTASYIVQRSEGLAASFYLVAILFFSRAATGTTPARRAALYALAALAGLLGVASKESVATLPVAALAYSVCFLADRSRRPRRLGRLAVAAALVLPLAYAVWLSLPYLLPPPELVAPDVPRTWMYIPTAGFKVGGVSSLQYLLTQFGVVVWYLRLAVLPTHQCFDYGWPLVDSPWRADVLLPLGVLLALLVIAVIAYRRYRLATFCILWILITLAPTSSVVPLRDAAFEQRMYLPLIGFAWLAIVGGYDLLAWAATNRRRDPQPLWRAGAAAAAVWIALLGAATVHRNAVFADPLRLAADTAAKAPDNWRAQYAFGDALVQHQRGDEAIQPLENAIRLDPRQGAPRVQLGSLYVQRHQLDDAERVLTPAISLLEESVVAAAYLQLAAVNQARGAFDQATLDLREALALKPDWAPARRQLAAIYMRQSMWFNAAVEYRTMVQLNPQLAAAVAPDAARASYQAGVALQQSGRLTASESMLRAALKYRSDWPAAQHYLAYVLAARGDWPGAEAALRQAAAAAPADTAISDNLRRAQAHEPLAEPPVDSGRRAG